MSRQIRRRQLKTNPPAYPEYQMVLGSGMEPLGLKTSKHHKEASSHANKSATRHCDQTLITREMELYNSHNAGVRHYDMGYSTTAFDAASLSRSFHWENGIEMPMDTNCNMFNLSSSIVDANSSITGQTMMHEPFAFHNHPSPSNMLLSQPCHSEPRSQPIFEVHSQPPLHHVNNQSRIQPANRSPTVLFSELEDQLFEMQQNCPEEHSSTVHGLLVKILDEVKAIQVQMHSPSQYKLASHEVLETVTEEHIESILTEHHGQSEQTSFATKMCSLLMFFFSVTIVLTFFTSPIATCRADSPFRLCQYSSIMVSIAFVVFYGAHLSEFRRRLRQSKDSVETMKAVLVSMKMQTRSQRVAGAA